MSSELGVRIGVFLVVFVTLVLLEARYPRRRSTLRRSERWPGAFSLFVTGAVLARLIVPSGHNFTLCTAPIPLNKPARMFKWSITIQLQIERTSPCCMLRPRN